MSARREKRRDRNGTEKWYWIVDFVFRHPDGQHDRIRRYSPVNTKRGAEAYEREIREFMLGLPTAGLSDEDKEQALAPPTTLEAFQNKFLSTCMVNKNKPSELASKRQILKNHLVPSFGKVALQNIDAAAIEDYKEEKTGSDLSAKTINNHLAVLGRMLRVACKRGIIDKVPEICPIRLTKTDADFLTFDEAARLLESAEGQLKTIVVFLLHTGLRIGELRALRWSDVDLTSGKIRIRRNDWYGVEDTPKSGKSRDIPLNSVVHEALTKHRHKLGEYVFCQSNGTKLGHNSYVRPLWAACRRAGLREVTWHVMRHSFASHLVMKGVPLKAIADLMGHSSTYVTERYSHLSPEVPRQAVDALAWHSNGTTREAFCKPL